MPEPAIARWPGRVRTGFLLWSTKVPTRASRSAHATARLYLGATPRANSRQETCRKASHEKEMPEGPVLRRPAVSKQSAPLWRVQLRIASHVESQPECGQATFGSSRAKHHSSKLQEKTRV